MLSFKLEEEEEREWRGEKKAISKLAKKPVGITSPPSLPASVSVFIYFLSITLLKKKLERKPMHLY